MRHWHLVGICGWYCPLHLGSRVRLLHIRALIQTPFELILKEYKIQPIVGTFLKLSVKVPNHIAYFRALSLVVLAMAYMIYRHCKAMLQLTGVTWFQDPNYTDVDRKMSLRFHRTRNWNQNLWLRLGSPVKVLYIRGLQLFFFKGATLNKAMCRELHYCFISCVVLIFVYFIDVTFF